MQPTFASIANDQSGIMPGDASPFDILLFEFCYEPWMDAQAAVRSPWFWLALLAVGVIGWLVVRRWRSRRVLPHNAQTCTTRPTVGSR